MTMINQAMRYKLLYIIATLVLSAEHMHNQPALPNYPNIKVYNLSALWESVNFCLA